jgi:hypothetical protein
MISLINNRVYRIIWKQKTDGGKVGFPAVCLDSKTLPLCEAVFPWKTDASHFYEEKSACMDSFAVYAAVNSHGIIDRVCA